MRLGKLGLGVGTAVVAGALAVGAGPALADAAAGVPGTGRALTDAGEPGTTFPEHPNDHMEKACSALFSNPNQGFHASDPAHDIRMGLFLDACLGR